MGIISCLISWTTDTDGNFVLEHLYGKIFCTSIVVLVVYIYWVAFHRPFDLYRDFSEFGYDTVDYKVKGKNNSQRVNLINSLRQRRKVGDLPPVFPNGWFAVAESQKLKVGEAVEIDAIGMALVAWRGESGKAYVADAHCPHIGAHLGVGGKVAGECIQCPFHSWIFDGQKEGKLTCIPYAERTPDFVKLKMHRIVETNGFIFLWFHAEGEDPTWHPDPIPEVESKLWRYRGRSEFTIACHVQEIPENGPDVAHLNVVHQDIINPFETYVNFKFLKHVWSAQWVANPSDSARPFEAVLTLRHHIRLLDCIPLFEINVKAYQIGPGMTLMFFTTWFGEGVLVQTTTPKEPLLQTVTHHFYSSPSFIHPIGKLILYGEANQISRDVKIWNRKCYVSKPILTKEDSAIKSFRRWFSQFYSENSPTYYFSQSRKISSNERTIDF